MKMKIGLDCSTAVLKNKTGVGNYAFNLAHALTRIDKENFYIFYPYFYRVFLGIEKDFKLPRTENSRVAYENLPHYLFYFLLSKGTPSFLKEKMLGDVDIVHSTNFSAPRLMHKKLVVTIYDLTVFTHPECHQKGNIDFCAKGIRDSLLYADKVIAISEHTKKDLMEILNAPSDMISVTQLAAGSDYYEVKDLATIRQAKEKYGLPEEYVLFVGSLEPRKNIKGLLKAYSAIPVKLRKDFPLVIAGGKGWLNSDIPALVDGLDIKESVRFTGYIDGNDISAVYSGASVFAYPSLYEGFGLPILEAMSCGAPVITSNTSSMPEVAGDAALLVDPLNADELAFALETVLEKEDLRADMRKKGLARASQFSWDRCAHETLEVYRKVMASPKRN
jgi:glycosyltransferase involved in cell wall biosynthesis